MDTKGHCFPKSIIIQAVYFKLRFPLSYRDVKEIMRIRGVEVGHISTVQALLGCIVYSTGRKLTFDGKTERFVNDDDANTYLARPGRRRKPINIPDMV